MTTSAPRPFPARLAIALAGVLLAAGCDGDQAPTGTAAEPPMSTSAERPVSSSTTTTKPPESSVPAPAAKGPTAEEVVVGFRQAGLPVQGWTLFTAETDDERLLGKRGQYTSKVSFNDGRLTSGGGTEASNLASGGVVEVFATAADAARRAAKVKGKGTVHRKGRYLLRLSSRLSAGQVRGYKAAMAKLPG
jgi:hypothetical protein